MPEAIRRVFPMAQHQMCLVHETRTICRDVRKSDRKQVSDDFRYVYTARGKAEAELRLATFESKWEKTYPSMVRKLRNQDNLFTFMYYPELLWKTIYTSNTIESFNAKLKRLTRKRILLNSEEASLLGFESADLAGFILANPKIVPFLNFGSDIFFEREKIFFWFLEQVNPLLV